MPQPADAPRGQILPNGLRIVGRGAEQIAERAAAYAVEHLSAGAVADTLYALRCTMPPVVAGRTMVERVLDGITDEICDTWAECPRLLRDEPAYRAPSRFGGLEYDVLAEPGVGWTGEVVWRSVHRVVAGAPVTTRVLLEERPTFTRLNVRVTADGGTPSVRGYVGAGQSQPLFVRALRSQLTPTWMGGPLIAHDIAPGGVPDFVRSVLAASSRDVPVAVLSPEEDGSFIVDPHDFAWDLLGRARLYVIRDHRETFRLSDEVGDRRMSSYWGAVRCYMPGWTRHDDPLEHPLLTADRLADPVMRATWLGEIGIRTGAELTLPPSIRERRAPDSDPPAVTVIDTGSAPTVVRIPGSARTDGAAAIAKNGAADPPAAGNRASDVASPQPTDDTPPAPHAAPAPVDTSPLIETLISEVRALAGMVGQLTDEVERLRTIAAVRSSSTSSIERRLGRLEDILEQAFPDGTGARMPAAMPADGEDREEDRESGPALVEVVQAAAESYSDALLLLDSAHTSAADSPYEDPERVRAILDAMARVARRRRDGTLGTSLREAFSDLGIDYRPAIARSTSARLRQQYRFSLGGDSIEAEEHIALGGTYDPRRCLRIYFSSRVPTETRFVIAHVGRHFDVKTTS